jgi:hypothetical protein
MVNRLWLGVLTVAVSGCVSRTGGQLGHASFSYEECLFGCATSDSSLAAGGARAVIDVSLASGYSFAAVRSTSPAVATFTIGGGSGTAIDVLSGAPGTTQLQLVDANGRIVDQTAINVAPTATLKFTRGWSGPVPLVLAGTPQFFHVTTTDGGGHTTIGTGSVAFTLAGTLMPTASFELGGDSFGFAGTPGSGSVIATTQSGATARLDVNVLPADSPTSLTANNHGTTVDSSGSFATVDVTANSAAGPVYGAQCTWTTSDPSVTVRSQTAASLEHAPVATTQLNLGKPGSFIATCTIGGNMVAVPVKR